MDLKPGKGFAAGSGNYVPGAISLIHPEITEKIINTPQKLTDAQIGEIKGALDARFPVVVQIDVNPKTVENDTHYSPLVDYDNADENNFTLADTLGGQAVSLKKYLGFLRPSARESIYRYIIYSGNPPKDDGKTVVVPADIYPNIIHGSTEWDKTVGEYLPGRDPKTTPFEDVRSVVGGFKSRVTTVEGERDEAIKAQKLAETEAQNQKDKAANIEAKCQRDIEAKNAEVSVLKQSAGDVDKLIQSYEGRIGVVEDALREAQRQGGIKDTQITNLRTDLDAALKGKVKLGAFASIGNFIDTILKRK